MTSEEAVCQRDCTIGSWVCTVTDNTLINAHDANPSNSCICQWFMAKIIGIRQFMCCRYPS